MPRQECAGKNPSKGFAVRASRAMGGLKGPGGSKRFAMALVNPTRYLGSMLAINVSVVPSRPAKRKGLTLWTRISPDEGCSSSNVITSSANTSRGTPGRAASNSQGEPERVIDLDALIDDIMLYGLPNAGPGSARFYWEAMGKMQRQGLIPYTNAHFSCLYPAQLLPFPASPGQPLALSALHERLMPAAVPPVT